MKKISALIMSLVMSLSAVTPFCAMADPEEDYLPIMYLSVEDNEKISVMPDGTVYINSEDLTGDDSIRVNIYIRDDSKSCWIIAPKVKCEKSYITFNEEAVENETTAYNSQHEFISTINTDYNTVNITFKTPLMEIGTKLEVESENTDDYPIAYFNASVDSEIPAGNYRIYFLTEPEDEPDQRFTQVSFRYDDGDSQTLIPEVKEQKIVVSDRKLGDVNKDGLIDATDATLVLMEYSALSTGQESTFDVAQKNASDVDMDELINAVDATHILSYYAYLSTSAEEGRLDFAEYLKSNQNE